jgi:hypothetical protein
MRRTPFFAQKELNGDVGQFLPKIKESIRDSVSSNINFTFSHLRNGTLSVYAIHSARGGKGLPSIREEPVTTVSAESCPFRSIGFLKDVSFVDPNWSNKSK